MKRFTGLGLVAILVVLVSALAFSSSTASRSIFLWEWGMQPDVKKWMEDTYYPAFTQATGIKVNYVEMPGEVEQTLRLALKGGGGPDLLSLNGPSYVPPYVDAGFLIPLDEYAEKYGWKDLLPDLEWQLGMYKGKLYTLPGGIEAMLLFYNPTVFKENGWTPPKTIEEMDKLAGEMKAKGIMPFANGNVNWRPADEWMFTAAVNAIAGPEKVYEALRGKLPWTDPSFVKAVEETRKWYQQGWLGGGKYFSLDMYGVSQLLVEGKAGMAINGTWAMQDLIQYNPSPEAWDWVPFPSAEGVDYPVFAVGFGWSTGINANAKDPDAAAQYIDFGLREPYNRPDLFAESLGLGNEYTPIKGIDWTEEYMKKLVSLGADPRSVRFVRQVTQALQSNRYGYTTWTFWPPKSDRYIIDNISKVWLGKESSEQFLEGLQEVFNEELKAGSTLYIPPRG